MSFGRFQRRSGGQPLSDINMTPLIDVMLVLLVIFMVTAPLMSSSLRLDLPKTDAATPSENPSFIKIGVDASGQLYWGDERIDRQQLAQRTAQSARDNPQTEVQLRADKTVPYGEVAELIGVVQKAGLVRIAFVAEPGPGPVSRSAR